MTTAQGADPHTEKLPPILALVAVIAVVIPASLLGGAFAAPAAGLPDVGALIRWGIPIVRGIHDLAAAGTVGLLLVAATIIPEARDTNRRITAARYACASGVVWVLAGLVGLLAAAALWRSAPAHRRRGSHLVLAVQGVVAAATVLGLAAAAAAGPAVLRLHQAASAPAIRIGA